MKSFSIFSIFIIVALAFTSCKKEIRPTLIISVVDPEGKAAPNATVHVHPGKYADEGVINESEMDQKGTSDSQGSVSMEFRYSAVLDVDVEYVQDIFDDVSGTYKKDTLIGHKTVKIEVKRQRVADNTVNEIVTVEKK